jgi:hypothetical protein
MAKGNWEGPGYCLAGFCTYWTELRDIALISRNSTAGRIIAQVSQTQAVLLNKQAEDDTFSEREIAGKGIGLVAARHIRKGEIVLKRRPSFLVQVEAEARTKLHVRDEIYRHALEGMNDQDRASLLRMMGSDLGDKIDKNCFRLRLKSDENSNDGDHLIGCFPTCLVHHRSCTATQSTNKHCEGLR